MRGGGGKSILDDADAIVIYADGTSVIGKGWEKMDHLVTKNKVGVVFMHYAVHPSVDKGEQYYLPWIGGFFKNGVSVNPFWRAKIKPMKGHETARGVGPIDAVDEFYFNIEYTPKRSRLEPRLQRRRIFITLTTYGPKKAFSPKERNNPSFGESSDPTEERSRFYGRAPSPQLGNRRLSNARDEHDRLGRRGPSSPGGVPTYKVTEDELNEQLDDYGTRTNRVKLPTEADVTFTPGAWMSPEEHAGSGRKPQK